MQPNIDCNNKPNKRNFNKHFNSNNVQGVYCLAIFSVEYEQFCRSKRVLSTEAETFGQRFNNLHQAALLTSFWRHWFNIRKLLTSSLQNDKVLSKFGQQQLVMVKYVCGHKQSETVKYFEWHQRLDKLRDGFCFLFYLFLCFSFSLFLLLLCYSEFCETQRKKIGSRWLHVAYCACAMIA